MDGSLVDMKCGYSADGLFTMESKITCASGKVLDYSYSKTIAANPQQLTLFFVSEGSYIDGDKAKAAGISLTTSQPRNLTTSTFNLAGQKVDENYRGVVIKNGRKVIRR